MSGRRSFPVLLFLACAGASWLAAAPAGAESPTPEAGPVDGGGPDGGEIIVTTPEPEPEFELPPPPPVPRLTEVRITGTLYEPADRLARFLGLEPGTLYGAAEMIALPEALERLGYTLDGPPELNGTRLSMKLQPLKLVRTVRVKGNFPLFDDKILRHLSFASGTQLPPVVESYLREEAKRVSEFLAREGYFGNKVTIEQRERPEEHAVDLIVRVELGGWFRPYTLQTVHAQGNRAVTDGELFDVFSHGRSIWGRFSLQRMRDDARKAEELLKKRGYPAARVLPEFDEKRDLDVEQRRVSLAVKVTEKRRVDVKFVGNRAVSERDLRDQLTIFTTGAYDEIELEESARSIVRYYQQRGHFEARVSFRRRRLETAATTNKEGAARNDIEEVTYLIEEGPELRVRDVEVVAESGTGPLSLSSDELLAKAQVATKVFPRLGAIGLGSGGYVTAIQLQQDAERLVGYYKTLGYPRAQVRGEVARDPAAFEGLGALGAAGAGASSTRTDLYVRFYVSEGPHEVCDGVEVSFVGEHIKQPAELGKLLALRAGVGFTEERLADDARRIVAAYRRLGRPYVQADFAGSTWNADHTRIQVRFRVSEGPEVRFGEILIRGNFRTRARVIMKDLPFRAGDLFDLDKLEQGERNLQNHFIFDSVRLTPVGLSAQRNPVPILVSVRERYIDYGGFLLSVGVSSDRLPNYAFVSASYIWSNFFGFGSQLEVRGDFGFSPDAWGVLGRYSDPRVFGANWRFDLNGFYRSEVTNRLGVIKVGGMSTALTRAITPSLRAYARFDLYQSQTEAPLARLPGTDDTRSVTDATLTVKLNLGIIWDRLVGADGVPNPLAPYKGWRLQAQVGAASRYFGGDNDFLLVAAQALVVQPFKIRDAGFSFMANLRFDQGIPIGEPALPVVERYYAGGNTQTRGYENDLLKSEVIRSGVSPLPGAAGFRVVPQGGNIRVLSTVEFQFPIAKTFLTLPFPWVGAVFWDVGAVFDGWNVLSGKDIKNSIGGTLLRVLTPFGPLSLEYAYPINPGPAEERWRTNPWYSHWPGRIHFNWAIPLARF